MVDLIKHRPIERDPSEAWATFADEQAQVNHSGVNGAELPVTEYVTSLGEAVKQGVVDTLPDTPEHPALMDTAQAVNSEAAAPGETEQAERTSSILPVPTLENPRMRSTQSGERSKRPWYIAAGVAATAVAATVTAMLSSGNGSANESHPTSHATSTERSGTVSTQEKVPPIDSVAISSPTGLDSKFLSLVVDKSNEAAARESYQYLTPETRKGYPLNEWINLVTTNQVGFSGTTPVLRNGSELLAAANTHETVEADNFLQGNDGNYNLTVREVYDKATDTWSVAYYGYEHTQLTQ